jgi:hypothetical protein
MIKTETHSNRSEDMIISRLSIQNISNKNQHQLQLRN